MDDTLLGLTVKGQTTGAIGGTYFGATSATGTDAMTLGAPGNYPIIARARNTSAT